MANESASTQALTLQELARMVERIGRFVSNNGTTLTDNINERIMESRAEESRRLNLLHDALTACREYVPWVEFVQTQGILPSVDE